ncbi:hypothetical protein A2933_00240 [Candidatus Nomurabacteria bacterium RIFCSPLOWO2_01_FULL_46_18]|uniref:Small-conductance mechanosensitive ion channel n=1 Tax=Candidatus Nomurabacteria bacterium RIFCSPLOWO2_01_FULL_46_18 TaxID=1801783 RepID=A0A1F6XBK2_9BACT|nr:MAG: hypothetical protein A2933_00240 [Candidatus Nomurabacteria bacterium RIFCSPLOWO2_01_FULL_46_18]
MNNIWVTWGDVFSRSLQDLWIGSVQFAPKLILAVVLFIIGWVLGSLVARAFEQVLGALKVDKLLASVKADDLLRQAGMNLNTGHFIGQVAKWFIVLVFLLPSLDLLGLDSIRMFLVEDVIGYLPHVIVAAFILIIASVVSQAVAKLVAASTRAMSVASANMLGTITKYAVWIFALIIALGELGIAREYMGVLFTGLIGMLALAGGLAFGLGGKDTAARFLAKVNDEGSKG